MPLLRSSLLDVALSVWDSPCRLSNLCQCTSPGVGKVARERADSPPIVTKAPDRAVATWREVCESGQEWESTPFVFSRFTSLFNSHEHAFRHDAVNLVFVRTFYYNVTAKPSPHCVRFSRQRTARRGDRLLSHVEMCGLETLTRKKNKNKNYTQKNATQYIYRLIYHLRQLA